MLTKLNNKKNSSNNEKLNSQLHIGGTSLSRVTETSFLGTIINENLSWESHVKKESHKVAKGLYAINSTEHILPLKHLRQSYNALILPHLAYGIVL